MQHLPSLYDAGLVMLQKLAFIIALDREKHFGRAAESCGVAQPTFSQGIQQLEEHFNSKLVDRSSRFLGFTPQGERVLIWARRLVGDAEAMQQDILGYQELGAHVRIAVVPSAIHVIASITNIFKMSQPSTRLTILIRTSDELMTLLRKREIDLGFTYLDDDYIEDIDKIRLYREQYSLLTATQGAADESAPITWRDVAKLPLCLLTPNFQQRRIVDKIFRSLGVHIVPAIETDSVMGLVLNVIGGNLSSVIPTTLLESMSFGESVRVVPIEAPPTAHTIGIVLSKRFLVSSSVQCLIEATESLRASPVRAGGQIDWLSQ